MGKTITKKKTTPKEKEYPYITSHPRKRNGTPIIKGTSTAVRNIVGYYEMYDGDIDEILISLPFLTRNQIKAALDFYEDHKQEIDKDIAENKDIGR